MLFLGIAKQISPEVDVSIGDDTAVTSSDEVQKAPVDERLKLLQMEDEGQSADSDNTCHRTG